MRTTHEPTASPQQALWLLLPLTSLLALAASSFLYHSAHYTYEKALYLLAICAASFFLIWTASGLLFLALAKVLRWAHIPLWFPWFLKPLILGSLGTATLASAPALAQETVAAETMQSDQSPSIFFTLPEPPENISSHSSLELASSTSIAPENCSSTKENPSIFFRDPCQATEEIQPLASFQEEYVVLQGDTLWSIAQGQLPPEATGAQVLQKAHSIYLNNQDQLDSLDAVIYPGQILTLPQAN